MLLLQTAPTGQTNTPAHATVLSGQGHQGGDRERLGGPMQQPQQRDQLRKQQKQWERRERGESLRRPHQLPGRESGRGRTGRGLKSSPWVLLLLTRVGAT